MVPLAAAAVLAGCAQMDPEPTPSPTSSVSATPTPTPTGPVEPVLVPDGSATDNLAVFAHVVAGVWESEDKVRGRDYIDALVATGFDKSRMQVTRDKTTVGNPAESIQFSVQWDDAECIIGQVGPATGDPVVVIMPALAEGGCLIGDTRPIDW